MTELSFLLDLLLNHKLPKATREAVTARIRDVEAGLSSRPIAAVPRAPVLPPGMANQSASTLAAMERHAQLAPVDPQPVVAVAQTPATQAALAARQETINLAISGKPEKGRTSPRKF